MPKEPTKNPLDSKYENITNKLSVCSKVIEMMDTAGWKEIVGPRLANMISEYSGTTKLNGLRSKGLIARSINEYEMNRNTGRLEGLIEAYNMITSHPVNYESFKNQLESIDKRANEEPVEYTGGY